jgi:hypothetical protein
MCTPPVASTIADGHIDCGGSARAMPEEFTHFAQVADRLTGRRRLYPDIPNPRIGRRFRSIPGNRQTRHNQRFRYFHEIRHASIPTVR